MKNCDNTVALDCVFALTTSSVSPLYHEVAFPVKRRKRDTGDPASSTASNVLF